MKEKIHVKNYKNKKINTRKKLPNLIKKEKITRYKI